MKELAAARAALERGDQEAAVAPLLAAWRAVKDPRIADVLDTMASRITRPALAAATHKKLVEQFVALVQAGDPHDPPRLAATIGTTRSAQMVEQLEALLEHWAPDPRFTGPLVELLKRPPFTGSATQSAWRRLFKLLQTYGDVRAIELLRALDFKALLRENAVWGAGHNQTVDNAFAATFFTERAAATIAAIEKAYAKQGTPRVTDEAALAAVVALAGPGTESTLLAEVLANPAEEGAREVLADHLLEVSDVRGRFMVLQRAGTLGPDEAKEERALFAAHGVQWLGELAALVDHDAMAYENGFLAWCAIDSDRLGIVKELTGHASWSTVRALHLDGNHFPHDFLVDPAMRSLACVTGIRDTTVDEIFRTGRSYPWRGVGMDPGKRLGELPERLYRAFPSLDELHLRAYGQQVDAFAFAWDLPLATLGFYAQNVAQIAAFLEVALERTPPSRVLDFTEYHHLGYRLRLSNERRELDLRSRAAWGRKTATWHDLARLVAYREAKPLAGTLSTIRVHGRVTKSERAAFERLLAPGGAIVIVD